MGVVLRGCAITSAKSCVDVLPSTPAMLLAVVSIVSKEWLFRVTKRVGDLLNSQIIIVSSGLRLRMWL
jgi:divalent metal cation (Fe/Co/Zn/Cd) transporter